MGYPLRAHSGWWALAFRLPSECSGWAIYGPWCHGASRGSRGSCSRGASRIGAALRHRALSGVCTQGTREGAGQASAGGDGTVRGSHLPPALPTPCAPGLSRAGGPAFPESSPHACLLLLSLPCMLLPDAPPHPCRLASLTFTGLSVGTAHVHLTTDVQLSA